ncbi:MAG: GyrI-like domain-containing protein [Rhodothermaceae bacterium]
MTKNNSVLCVTTDYKKRICLAMNYISKNIERDLPLEEIAKSASFSMFHFHRIFKAVVGETVAGFTRRLRLELAANRLTSTHFKDITTTAIESGFSSSQNFARAFRQHFGVTPSEYRNSKIGNNLRKNGNSLCFTSEYTSDSLNINSLTEQRRKRMKFEIRELPEHNVVYFRKIGAYMQTCPQAFGELVQWAEPRNLIGPKKVLGIYWDNPEVTPQEKCRFDACVIVPEEIVVDSQIDTFTAPGPLTMVFTERVMERTMEDELCWFWVV